MIVHFAPHFASMPPAASATAAGEVALGPGRLLDLLELRLGLPPARARPGEALLAYRACLAEADDTARFYHRSFGMDPIGAARALLDWRARWYEAGWSGTFDGRVSTRLRDLAEVERLARGRVPPTEGQRLRRVQAALEQGLGAQIERIVLHAERAEFPAAWQAVLEHFEVRVATGVNAAPSAVPGSDLHRVQRALLALTERDEGKPRVREALDGDASLIVVRSVSRDLSAQAIGEYLLKAPARDEALVIAERDGIIVDNAFERVGLPRAGFQHHSRFRAVNQVLKLCLSLVWNPVRARVLLQFLIHPVGPLPGFARSELARAVADEPGIGGTAWRRALEKVAQWTEDASGGDEVQAAERLREIEYWLECERYSPDDGAPLTVLGERARRCMQWLTRQLHATEDDTQADLLAAAVGQAEALIGALDHLRAAGTERIARIELERIVDEVSSHAADPGTFAQAGHVRAAIEPGAVTAPWRTVIWWDLAPDARPLAYPWSEAELAELASEGVALPSVDQRILARMRTWLRPVLNAREQLILAIHDRDAGHHPLWNQISSLFEGCNEVDIENDLLEAQPASDTRASAAATIPALEIPIEPLALAPLPRLRRWWQLSGTCRIPARETESFSSLNKLINYPHEWVLSYAARLNRGRAADLTSGKLLFGKLAHRLLETFFNGETNWIRLDERDARAWLAERLPKLLAEEGALLGEPGAGIEREQVAALIENAFIRLLGHLRSAGIQFAAAEQTLDAPFKDAKLVGQIDLLLRDRNGREIVLDVKWGGQDFRGRDLAQDRYLQLATYAYLRRHAAGGGSWPYHAYYIVSTGNIVAPDTSVFPDAIAAAASAPADIDTLWKRAGATYDWRRGQIDAGLVEVNARGTEPTERSSPPANALATAEDPDGFDEFIRLTGWVDGA